MTAAAAGLVLQRAAQPVVTCSVKVFVSRSLNRWVSRMLQASRNPVIERRDRPMTRNIVEILTKARNPLAEGCGLLSFSDLKKNVARLEL